MPDEQAIIAIGRIERALARIEAAIGNAQPASPDNHELQLLRERHRSLREKVEGAVSQIDLLLANRKGA
jgi:capsule polysaccharide export protein KpsE/RkpR